MCRERLSSLSSSLALGTRPNFELYHERNNPFDRFAIKFCEAGKEETIGHIPMEISRVTKYFMDRGATVNGGSLPKITFSTRRIENSL